MRLVAAGGPRIHRPRRKSIVGQFSLLLIALQILFLSSFVVLQLPTGTGHNLANYSRLQAQTAIGWLPETARTRVYGLLPELKAPVKSIRFDSYSIQAPTAIFLGYVFGNPIAPLAVALFILAGILGPMFGVYLFASGGGWEYYTQPGFGYLIGLIAASLVVATITRGPRTSLRQFAGLLLGLFCQQFIGIVYVLGSSLAFAFSDQGPSGPSWLPWVFEQIRNLSWYPLPYDAIFGLVLIGLGFPARLHGPVVDRAGYRTQI